MASLRENPLRKAHSGAGLAQGSRVEGAQDSTAPQTITTGTRDSLSEGDKAANNKSPRSTLEGPMLSTSTLISAQQLAEARGMRGSNDWRRDYQADDLDDEDDEGDFEDDDTASGAHRDHESASGAEESNLRRSARNHGTDSRRVSDLGVPRPLQTTPCLHIVLL